MSFFHPRLTIAALRGGSGKTILSLGLVSAMKARGHKVAVFKKGPDFIDSGWLSFAAENPCYNLDPFLMTRDQVLHSFVTHSAGANVSIIEGNRGLYDGLDLDGCCSTGELAKTLGCPVILIADVTMATRTIAALVLGCQTFDPDLKIAGVILNKVAGRRQESIVRGAIEQHCALPVVGAIPKLKGSVFPERHMGLVPHLERDYAQKAIHWAGSVAEKYLDIDSILKISGDVGALSQGAACTGTGFLLDKPLRVGVIRDRSFWFYYPENLEHLKSMGATLVEIDSMQGKSLPEIDALYIGGGFPETQAEALAENKGFRVSLRKAIEENLPVYAECGGLMYLGERLLVGEKTYPMVGALPLSFALEEKPQGHGYTVMEVDQENPFYQVGEVLKGHEFHYSRVFLEGNPRLKTIFKVQRGGGVDGERDGILDKNLLATYTHLHAGGTALWGEGLLRTALASLQPRRRLSDTPEKVKL